MSTVVLSVMVAGKGAMAVQMPGATLGYRAAQRVVEQAGGDPEDPKWEYALKVVGGGLVDSETPISEYAGRELLLLQKRRGISGDA